MCHNVNDIKSSRNTTFIIYFQDELEFGYIDSPHQRFPVVLDSPRDGELNNFPYGELLVRDLSRDQTFQD